MHLQICYICSTYGLIFFFFRQHWLLKNTGTKRPIKSSKNVFFIVCIFHWHKIYTYSVTSIYWWNRVIPLMKNIWLKQIIYNWTILWFYSINIDPYITLASCRWFARILMPWWIQMSVHVNFAECVFVYVCFIHIVWKEWCWVMLKWKANADKVKYARVSVESNFTE